MNNTTGPMYPNCQRNLTLRILVLPLMILTFLNIGCTTTCHRHEAARHVIDEQADVLRLLKAERDTREVASRTQADSTLARAEAHLREAILSLEASNQTLRAEF